MKLFGFIEFLDLLPVGRNARCLRTLPTTEIGSTQPVVILSETKDLKARFFANEAQNDKIKNGCARIRKSFTNQVPKPRLLRRSASTLYASSRNDGKSYVIASTSSRAQRSDLSFRKPNEKSGSRRAECPSLPAPRYCARVRHSAESNQASKTGGVRNRSGFRPTGLINEPTPILTPSLRDAPSKEGVKRGIRFVILSETKDLDIGKKKERFFAKDAQNNKIKNGCASRVQPRNPAYKSNMSQNDGNAGGHGNTLRALCQPLRLTSSTTSWFPFSKEKAKVSGARMTIVLLCLMLLLLVVSPVGAQVPTTRLFFNPTPLQIDTTIDPTSVVTLEVADGVDIFAFDLFVQYDPSLLSVSQVTLGDFLGEGLFCMDQVNEPGLVHYNCTRFAVDTGVSGSGVLLELTFEALGQGGDTLLTLGASELYNWPDALPVELTLEDGAVSVRPYWTFLPLILSASGQSTEVMP